jgi:uncharacterized membrane protein
MLRIRRMAGRVTEEHVRDYAQREDENAGLALFMICVATVASMRVILHGLCVNVAGPRLTLPHCWA